MLNYSNLRTMIIYETYNREFKFGPYIGISNLYICLGSQPLKALKVINILFIYI